MYKAFGKRFLDIFISFCTLLVLSPLILVLSILVRTKLGSPIFFCQERPGLHGEIFKLYKFRSMTDEKDAEGKLLPDHIRLTKFGKLLRATSLDELPELFNILKGDMSLIGPRPLLVEYLPYYTEEESLRHTVRPGLTGLAQVSGRNFLDWDRRLQKDVEYVRHLTFLFDIKIIFMTVKAVFSHADVAEDTNAAEGNFAQIRRARMEQEASCEQPNL